MWSKNQTSLAVCVDYVQEENVEACRTDFSMQVRSLCWEVNPALEATGVESIDLYA
jgi:hypothetical protein